MCAKTKTKKKIPPRKMNNKTNNKPQRRHNYLHVAIDIQFCSLPLFVFWAHVMCVCIKMWEYVWLFVRDCERERAKCWTVVVHVNQLGDDEYIHTTNKCMNEQTNEQMKRERKKIETNTPTNSGFKATYTHTHANHSHIAHIFMFVRLTKNTDSSHNDHTNHWIVSL